MAEKRKRVPSDDHDRHHQKKARKGFTVGPANLPEGLYKRKTQKIKDSLIQRAQIKKTYAKLKKLEAHSDLDRIPEPASLAAQGGAQGDGEVPEEPSTVPHPDRQNLMDHEERSPSPAAAAATSAPGRRTQRKPKTLPFRKEHETAQRQRAEAEERQRAREQAERERAQKREERERFRKAMAKARTGGPNGQRKLGRESAVLLEKVKRMVG
nr:hypothetical protein CFP56_64776 [Quercus suber]